MNVTGYLGRNGLRGWGALNPRLAYAEKKLMDAYRKDHPNCEVCGTDKEVQIHHLEPLWKNTAQAGTNPVGRFKSLCMYRHDCHLFAGHSGNFGNRYVENLEETVSRLREAIGNMKVVTRENTVDQ